MLRTVLAMILLLSGGCGASGQFCAKFSAGSGDTFEPSVQLDIKTCIFDGTPLAQCVESVLLEWKPEP